MFFALLISTLGRFNPANKKNICHIHFKALKQSNQDTSCNTSIDDKVKFVCEHTEVQPWKLH